MNSKIERAARARRFLRRHIDLRPIAEVTEGRFAGSAGKDSRPDVEKSTEHVVMHPGNLGGLRRALPRLTWQPEIEIYILPIIHCAQGRSCHALVLAGWDVRRSVPHTNAFGVQQNSGGMIRVVEKQQSGITPRLDFNIDLDRVRMPSHWSGQGRSIGNRFAPRGERERTVSYCESARLKVPLEPPLQTKFRTGEVVRWIWQRLLR